MTCGALSWCLFCKHPPHAAHLSSGCMFVNMHALTWMHMPWYSCMHVCCPLRVGLIVLLPPLEQNVHQAGV